MSYIYDIIFKNILKMYMQEEEIEQEEFVEVPLPEFKFNLSTENKFKGKYLLIGFYGAASIFLSSFVDVSKPVCEINFIRPKQKSMASVYVGEDCVFIIFNMEMQKMKEVHFAKMINKWFEFEEAIMITTVARGMLEKNVGGNLMHIATSKFSSPIGPRFLEGWSGMEADLLQYGEVSGKPVVCYIGIIDEYQMEKSLIKQTFGALEGKNGLNEARFDNSKQIKQYNMAKNASRLYL